MRTLTCHSPLLSETVVVLTVKLPAPAYAVRRRGRTSASESERRRQNRGYPGFPLHGPRTVHRRPGPCAGSFGAGQALARGGLGSGPRPKTCECDMLRVAPVFAGFCGLRKQSHLALTRCKGAGTLRWRVPVPSALSPVSEHLHDRSRRRRHCRRARGSPILSLAVSSTTGSRSTRSSPAAAWARCIAPSRLPWAASGHQGAQPELRGRARPGVPQALLPRGEHRVEAHAPEHGDHLRLRPDRRRHLLHGDGVPGGAHAPPGHPRGRRTSRRSAPPTSLAKSAARSARRTRSASSTATSSRPTSSSSSTATRPTS